MREAGRAEQGGRKRCLTLTVCSATLSGTCPSLTMCSRGSILSSALTGGDLCTTSIPPGRASQQFSTLRVTPSIGLRFALICDSDVALLVQRRPAIRFDTRHGTMNGR